MNERHLSKDCKPLVQTINIGGNRFLPSIPAIGKVSHLLNVIFYEITILWEDGYEPDVANLRVRDSNMQEIQTFNVFDSGQLHPVMLKGYTINLTQDLIDLILNSTTPIVYVTVEP